MKKLLLITLLLLISPGLVAAHTFEFNLNKDAKEYDCLLQYDNQNDSIHYSDKAGSKEIEEQFKDNVSLSCNNLFRHITFKLYDDDNNLIYSETKNAKNKYEYTLKTKEVDLEFNQDNICQITTGIYTEEYEIEEDDELQFEFINKFIITCDSDLEDSSILLSDDTSFNLKYKVFEKGVMGVTIDLSKPIINYKNKLEVYFRLNDSKDSFKCRTKHEGKEIEFINEDKKLIFSKTIYTNNEFVLNCDYKFKLIQIFVEDSYLGKELNDFEYNNIDKLNLKLDTYQIKPVEKKEEYNITFIETNNETMVEEVEKIEIKINDDLTDVKNLTISITLNKTKVVNESKGIAFKPLPKQEEKVGFFRSIWNWFFN